MADTYTEFLNLTKPEVGGSRDSWGVKQNDNLGKLDAWAKALDATVKSNTALANAAMPRAGGIFSGAISATNVESRTGAAGANGYSSLVAGSVDRPGYVEFRMKDGTRAGYVGWSDGAKKLSIQGENGFTFDFGQVPTIGGKPVYFADNLDLSSRVAKSGDNMSGGLGIISADGLKLEAPNTSNWRIRPIGGNRLQFCDAANTVEYFSFGVDGTFSTRQLGDLNSRIEARGAAYQQAAYNQCVSSIRQSFAGDLYNSWNLNNGMAEPYGGSYMSSRATVADGTANGAWIPGIFRWRTLQFYNPSLGGWVSSYYI